MYQEDKQTVAEIARKSDVSPSTIKRVLRNITVSWEQPDLAGRSGFVHLDVTYWGHNWGVFLALEEESCRPLYIAFIHHETIADYEKAVKTIADLGYVIKGIVIDGMRSLFDAFSSYKIQMCQYHMLCIVERYLTKNPHLKAARGLKDLMKRLVGMTKDEFLKEYAKWKEDHEHTLNRRSVSKRDGKSHYTHKRLRTAMNSVDFYLPYLFTYQDGSCNGMPNTNNKIEGVFTDLKKNLNNHSGMSESNRRRFISGFFLALEDNRTCQDKKKAGH